MAYPKPRLDLFVLVGSLAGPLFSVAGKTRLGWGAPRTILHRNPFGAHWPTLQDRDSRWSAEHIGLQHSVSSPPALRRGREHASQKRQRGLAPRWRRMASVDYWPLAITSIRNRRQLPALWQPLAGRISAAQPPTGAARSREALRPPEAEAALGSLAGVAGLAVDR